MRHLFSKKDKSTGHVVTMAAPNSVRSEQVPTKTGYSYVPISTFSAQINAAYNQVFSTTSYPIPESTPTWEERTADLAAGIENFIADHMPDAHKDVPVMLAKKVVEAILTEVFPNYGLDAKKSDAAFVAAESEVAKRIANMTMQEYAAQRQNLLGSRLAGDTSAIYNATTNRFISSTVALGEQE